MLELETEGKKKNPFSYLSFPLPPLFPSITLSVTFLLILEPQFHILSKRYASTAVNRSSECDKSWPGGDRVIVEHTSA